MGNENTKIHNSEKEERVQYLTKQRDELTDMIQNKHKLNIDNTRFIDRLDKLEIRLTEIQERVNTMFHLKKHCLDFEKQPQYTAHEMQEFEQCVSKTVKQLHAEYVLLCSERIPNLQMVFAESFYQCAKLPFYKLLQKWCHANTLDKHMQILTLTYPIKFYHTGRMEHPREIINEQQEEEWPPTGMGCYYQRKNAEKRYIEYMQQMELNELIEPGSTFAKVISIELCDNDDSNIVKAVVVE